MPEGKHAKSTNKPKRPAPMIVLLCLDGIFHRFLRDIQSVTQDLLQHGASPKSLEAAEDSMLSQQHQIRWAWLCVDLCYRKRKALAFGKRRAH